MRKIYLTFLFLLLTTVQGQAAWLDSDWSNRRSITIDNTKVDEAVVD